jgi:hypothetical protein
MVLNADQVKSELVGDLCDLEGPLAGQDGGMTKTPNLIGCP